MGVMLCTQLNLASNQLCGLNWQRRGTYTIEGIKAIAHALSVTTSLTKIDVRLNALGDDGRAALHKAVEGRSGFQLML